MPKRIFTLLSATSAFALLSTPVLSDAEAAQTHDNVEEIIISSRPLGETARDIGQSITVLAGEALERERALTIGQTLDSLPGLSQSSFGPAVSRPVIRGLGGDRIRILTNGIGTIDASTTSPDHGLAIDPEQAEKIEVLKGPATLLFGSNAVAGAVNIFDGRIPLAQPENGLEGYGHSHYGTNGDEWAISSGVTVSASDKLALHIDGSYSDRGDLEIPGFAESSALRALEEAEEEGEEHEGEEEEEIRDLVPGTGSERYSVAGGGTIFFDNGFLGASVSYFDNSYGLPEAGHGHEEEDEEHEGEEEEEGGPTINLDQLRVDLVGEWQVDFLAFEQINLRFGYADYEHEEVEGSGEVGAIFKNDGWEGRLELVQAKSDLASGVFGLQIRERDFIAAGEEAFVPPSITTQIGLFGLEKFTINNWELEAGVRLDFQEVESDDLNFDQDETTFSVSGAALYRVNEELTLSAYGFRSERAANVEELLSNGAHLATGLFELGDQSLGIETATGIDLRLSWQTETTGITASLYYTDYDDFIQQVLTGEVEDELPVSLYQATDARFKGFEVQFNQVLWQADDQLIEMELTGDYVRATDTVTDTPLPRTPPLSGTAKVRYEGPWVDFYSSLTLADSQTRTADFELETGSYADLRAGLTFHPQGPDSPLQVYVEGRNLLDEDIRHATSFLKDILPEAGMNVQFGVKIDF